MSKASKQKLAIKDILKGKFLVEEGAFRHWKFIFYIILLIFLMISSAHSVDKKTVKINKLNDEVQVLKAKYAFVSSELMNLKLESELTQQIVKDSLLPLEEHPFKIVVKPKKDSTNLE